MDITDRLKDIDDIEIERDVAMSERTSFAIGGPAESLVTVHGEAALATLLRRCRDEGYPWQLFGAGTNLLVADRGVRGVLLRIGQDAVAESVRRGVNTLRVQLSAGAPLTRLLQIMRENGALGVSALAGIPGSVGGAVVMNAGTRLGDCAQFIEAIHLCDADGIREISPADLHFAYRASALPGGAVIASARFKFQLGLLEEIEAEERAAREATERRRASQPNLASAGCVFCNPVGQAAGQLIEACGLKGRKAGGAEISQVHANFIVNRGGARSSDVLALMREAQSAVQARFGISLVPEIRFMGEFEAGELPSQARFSAGLTNLVSR